MLSFWGAAPKSLMTYAVGTRLHPSWQFLMRIIFLLKIRLSAFLKSDIPLVKGASKLFSYIVDMVSCDTLSKGFDIVLCFFFVNSDPGAFKVEIRYTYFFP